MTTSCPTQWRQPILLELPKELGEQIRKDLMAQDYAARLCHGCHAKLNPGQRWCSEACEAEMTGKPPRPVALVIDLASLLTAPRYYPGRHDALPVGGRCHVAA